MPESFSFCSFSRNFWPYALVQPETIQITPASSSAICSLRCSRARSTSCFVKSEIGRVGSAPAVVGKEGGTCARLRVSLGSRQRAARRLDRRPAAMALYHPRCHPWNLSGFSELFPEEPLFLSEFAAFVLGRLIARRFTLPRRRPCRSLFAKNRWRQLPARLGRPSCLPRPSPRSLEAALPPLSARLSRQPAAPLAGLVFFLAAPCPAAAASITGSIAAGVGIVWAGAWRLGIVRNSRCTWLRGHRHFFAGRGCSDHPAGPGWLGGPWPVGLPFLPGSFCPGCSPLSLPARSFAGFTAIGLATLRLVAVWLCCHRYRNPLARFLPDSGFLPPADSPLPPCLASGFGCTFLASRLGIATFVLRLLAGLCLRRARSGCRRPPLSGDFFGSGRGPFWAHLLIAGTPTARLRHPVRLRFARRICGLPEGCGLPPAADWSLACGPPDGSFSRL